MAICVHLSHKVPNEFNSYFLRYAEKLNATLDWVSWFYWCVLQSKYSRTYKGLKSVM